MVGEGRGRREGGCLSARIKHIEETIEMFLVIISVMPRKAFQVPRVKTTIMGVQTQRMEENVLSPQYSLQLRYDEDHQRLIPQIKCPNIVPHT